MNNNPYDKFAKDISKHLQYLADAICWIAQRVLSAKEFMEFTEKFTREQNEKGKGDDNDG